mmetsp:Transcript_11967/g.24292  ORF Transcript_11967/g.24292 Transcript_11967/m.24292 type:complete len:235 (-) Transcript_11967:379-1083(-)
MQFHADGFDLVVTEVLCMSQDSKSRHICARMGVVLRHETSTISIESSHTNYSLMHHVFRVFYSQNVFFHAFIPKPMILLSPLMHIGRNLCPQRLGQNQDISHFGSIRFDKFTFRDNCRRNTSNNRPRIQHGLSSRDGDFGFVARVPKPSNHFSCANALLLTFHIERGRQQHEHKVTMFDSFRIQITENIGGSNASLHVRRIHKWKKEVGGGDGIVPLSGRTDGAIEGNFASGRA